MPKIFLFILIIRSFLFAGTNNGLWVVRDALKKNTTPYKIVESAKKIGATKIFVQVFALGKRFYSPDTMSRGPKQKNILKNIIRNAHKSGIEVHAWLNCFFINGHHSLQKQRPEIYRQLKNSILFPFQKPGGDKGIFLYPGDKKYVGLLDMVIREMINNYHVDGIHLDYFRYPDYGIPLSIQARTDFKLQYYRDPLVVIQKSLSAQAENYRYYKHFVGLYRNFLRQRLTQTLVHIKQTVKAVSPSAMLSIAVKPDPVGARVKFLQPWEEWIRNGLCDFVAAMNYSKEPKRYQYNLKMIDRLGLHTKIMIGIAVHNISNRVVYERLKQIKNRNLYNFSLFSFNLLYGNRKLQNKIGRLINGND